jgi:putative redox protein
MEAKVVWEKRLSMSGTADSGFVVPLGAKAEVGGDEDGFQPMELIAIGLAGCTAMDVISILTKKRQDVKAFRVLVHAERASEHPKVFTRATIEYLVSGYQIDATALERAIELSATRYCPAQAMLGKVFPIEMKYIIFEGDGTENDQLVVSSGWAPPDLQVQE